MRKISLKLVSVLAALSLLLSGCIKYQTSATVNSDGTISGSWTLEAQSADLDALNDEILNQYDESFGHHFGVTAISVEDVSNCEVTEITFTLDEAAPMATNVSFSYVPANTDESLFVVGAVSSGGMNTLNLDAAVVIPASGDIDDCENISNIETGSLITFAEEGITNWQFGTIKDVRSSKSEDLNFEAGLLMNQLANIPVQDRGMFLISLELMLGSKMNEYSESTMPEFKPCGEKMDETKFNVLNFESLSEGEFEDLLDSFKIINVIHTDEVVSITCVFKNLPLEYIDRGANENPDVSASNHEDGIWLHSDEDAIWHYRLDASMGLSYDEVAADETKTIYEVSPDDDLAGDAATAYEQLYRTQTTSKLNVKGVVLDTNGMFSNNRVVMINRPWWVSNDFTTYYFLKGFEPQDYLLDVVLGDPIVFKAGSKKLVSKAKLITSYAKKIKKTKVDGAKVVNLVGIYDGSIVDPVKALKNEKLVTARLNVVQAKLKREFKKIKVRATFTKQYVVDDTPSGDSKAKNKVVIQITGN